MAAIAQHPHRVTSAITGVRAQLADLAQVPVWSMDPTETAAALDEATRAEAQLAELKARLLTQAERVEAAGNTGATSTANWHAVATRTTRAQAHRAMRLAHGLDGHDATRTALAAGRIHAEQAQAILRALTELPDTLDPELIGQAEVHLRDLAGSYDAKALKLLGRRILEVIDLETADAHEARLLEKEERDAAAATKLVIWDDGHGKTHGRFTLDGLSGAMFNKALLAFAAPKHRASEGPLGDRKPTPERLGQAFAEMIQRYPKKKLPKAGGVNATVVVTMTLESLEGGLKSAHLDTGQKISASLARRIACEAGIIPAVLGGNSEVLDLGRTKRYASEAQRIAKTIETGGCEVEGCDNPPGMAHMHHGTRWVDGGKTNLADLIMVCPRHHTRAHDQRYQMTKLPTGRYGFNRRT